jgi:hypothetical protein
LLITLCTLKIPRGTAQKLIEQHGEVKIKQKLDLLQQQSTKKKISNTAGWLVKALNEDWTHAKQQEKIEKKKAKEEELKKEAEKQKKQEQLNKLKERYQIYKENKAAQLYKALSVQEKAAIDAKFNIWFEHHTNLIGINLPQDILRVGFLVQNPLSFQDNDFQSWLATELT